MPTLGEMRWDDLFADLAAQFDAAHTSLDEQEVAEMARAEAATTTLVDRLRGRTGHELRLHLTGGHDRSGTLIRAHPDWFVLADGARRSLVPAAAIAVAWPLGRAAPAPGGLSGRLPLGQALRALAAEALPVLIVSTAGQFWGRIVRVGADHFDLRTETGVLAIAWSALVAVDSRTA